MTSTKISNYLPFYIKSLQRFLYYNSFYATEEYLNYNKQLNLLFLCLSLHEVFGGHFIISYFKIKC